MQDGRRAGVGRKMTHTVAVSVEPAAVGDAGTDVSAGGRNGRRVQARLQRSLAASHRRKAQASTSTSMVHWEQKSQATRGRWCARCRKDGNRVVRVDGVCRCGCGCVWCVDVGNERVLVHQGGNLGAGPKQSGQRLCVM